MKKYVVIVGIAIIVIGGGIVLAITMHSGNNGTSSSPTQAGVSATDFTDQKQVAVSMHDLSFSPANIKIKKGTTVTWTNQDTVAHNVVAADASSTGGLPTDAPTFGHGGTFSFTFNQTGTFDYLCIPHRDFMHGSVQVVD